MAAIGLHRGKYQVRIRRVGSPSISRTFSRKKDAEAWAVVTEQKMEMGDYESDKALRLPRWAAFLSVTARRLLRRKDLKRLRYGEKMKRSWISKFVCLTCGPIT